MSKRKRGGRFIDPDDTYDESISPVGWRAPDPVRKILGTKPAKRYPKPKYMKCNQGHTLVEVYNERTNAYDWDCPICIERMKREGGFGL